MAHILVAEDERDIRELVAFTLTFAGHEVTQAANGREAVDMTLEARPDLVILDVRMPRMTGYEACRAIKDHDEFGALPVVFLSARGQDEELEAGFDAGAADYILKPFAPGDLARRIAEILEGAGVS